MVLRPVLSGDFIQVPPVRRLLPGGYTQTPFRPTLTGRVVQVSSETDPLAGFNWAARLQTHNGNGVPLGLWQDDACTIPATQDFDPIGGWTDELSDSGVALTQSDPDKQPFLFFDNGVPTIVPDGVDDYLQGSIAGIAVTNLTVFALGAISSGAFYELSHNAGVSNACSAMFIDGGQFRFRITTTDALFLAPDGAIHSFTGVQATAARSVYLDGTMQNTESSSVNMSQVPAFLRMGNLFQFFGYPLNGSMISLMFSPDTFNPTNLGTVDTYLATLTP
jgi:hypothetical protein